MSNKTAPAARSTGISAGTRLSRPKIDYKDWTARLSMNWPVEQFDEFTRALDRFAHAVEDLTNEERRYNAALSIITEPCTPEYDQTEWDKAECLLQGTIFATRWQAALRLERARRAILIATIDEIIAGILDEILSEHEPESAAEVRALYERRAKEYDATDRKFMEGEGAPDTRPEDAVERKLAERDSFPE